MTRVTTDGLEIRERYPALTSVMWAPARWAMNVWLATGMTWSAVPITAQDGMVCKLVLVGLANHAGPGGTGAFPSVATLVRYTGLSERTVRTGQDRLAAERIIASCDPGIVAARIKRADHCQQGWDLNLAAAA